MTVLQSETSPLAAQGAQRVPGGRGAPGGQRAQGARQAQGVRQALRRPARLRAGSRVAVVAPSGRNDPDLVAEGCGVLAGWGLDVQVAPNVMASHDDFRYLAGPDASRAADLQRAWLDPRIEAVLCAKGGYGAQRIADLLDWAAMAEVPPKIFTGFSDITALHEAFALRLGVATLHSPNVGGSSFTTFPEAQESLRQALFEPNRAAPCVLTSDAAECLVPGRTTGLTAGGNLTLLAAGLGTVDGRQVARDGGLAGEAGELVAGDSGLAGGDGGLAGVERRLVSRDSGLAGGDGGLAGGDGGLVAVERRLVLRDSGLAGGAGVGFAGCILLLEDVGEECYRLDRMLTQLLRAGALAGVAGIALGTWTNCGSPDAVRQVMRDRLGGLGVPVVWGLDFGHNAPQPTIPLGVPAELDADGGTLTFLESAVL